MSILKINHSSKFLGKVKIISSGSSSPVVNITRSGSSTVEGFVVTYTVTTSNIAEGTLLPYVITGIVQDDLLSGSLSGDLVIDSTGSSSVALRLKDDGIVEGTETMTFYAGNANSSVEITDTSYSDIYTLGRSTESTDEGSTVTYTLSTTVALEGTVIPYLITGISQEDLSSGSITGNFVLDSNKQSSVSLTLANDLLTEGTETISIVADGRVQTTSVNDTSLSPNPVLLLNGNGINGSSNSLIADASPFALPFVRMGTPTLRHDDLTNSPSVYFDGSGDYYNITIGYTSYFQFTSNTFTVEAWVKFDTVSAIRMFLSNYVNTSVGWSLGTSNGKLAAWLSGQGVDISGTTTLDANVWYHIALVGSNGSYKLFLNGVQEGNTYTGATRLDGGALAVGSFAGGANFFKGYIKGLRVISGTNIYTQNFSENLPSMPFGVSNNTVLLINPSSPNIIDSTSKNKLIITEGNSEVTTTNFKYGTGSLYFDGNGDALKIPATTDLALYFDDFTIEFWCNFTDTNYTSGTCNRTIISQGSNNSSSLYWPNRYRIVVDAQTNRGNAVGGISFITNVTTGCKTVVPVNDGAWHHIAFTRKNAVMRCFVDGVLKSTVNNGTYFMDSETPYTIGRQGIDVDPCGYYKGFLDDIRIIKGAALYTQDFTPPTQGLTV